MKLQRIIDPLVCQLSHWKNKKEFDQLRASKTNYSLEGFDRLKCIFVHIPKAAGIAINNALFGNYGGGHKTVYAYKRIFGPLSFNRYYKFTFVRNPYSRLFSAYQFLKHGGFSEANKVWFDHHLSIYETFDEFVRKWINEKNIWSYVHFKPQYSFVCDINLKPEVDFIGKVESINKDFEEVCKTLGIENKLTIQNEGCSDSSDWKNHYSRYSLQKISEIYSHDFDIFDYEYRNNPHFDIQSHNL